MNDLDSLLEKAGEAVRRDLNHIFSEATASKLSAASARDLVAYYKLLSDVADKVKEKADELTSATEEELETLARKLLSEPNPTTSSKRAKEKK